jgi:uncharacterized protein YsxB (DUF464 family)
MGGFMRYLLILTILFFTAAVYAEEITVTSNEGSVTIAIPNVGKDGKVRAEEILKIVKSKLEKLEYDYVARLGRYERKEAVEELKAIKVLLSTLPKEISVYVGKEIEGEKKTQLEKTAMGDDEFKNLLSSVQKKRYSSDKISQINSASKSNYFTLKQLNGLIELFNKTDTNNMIKVIEMVYPRVIDKKEGYLLLDYFNFNSDKEKVKGILDKHKEE